MSDNENAIETRGLTRKFGRTTAVDNLSLAVPRGSLCALMGPNGAGKTTLIQMILGMLHPTGGDAHVLGTPLRDLRPAHFRRIGYVAEGQDVPGWLTAAELLAYCKGIYPDWSDDLARQLVKEFGIPLDRKLSRCSRGERMKALLVSAIGFEPELLVLDEPFSGLDPLTREEFSAGLLAAARDGNWSLLLSSHDADDVERLVDRAVFIEQGRLVLNEDCDTLKRQWRRVEVLFQEAPEEKIAGAAEVFPGATISGRRLRFIDQNFEPEACRARLRKHFNTTKFELSAHPLSLREAYVELAKIWKLNHSAHAA